MVLTADKGVTLVVIDKDMYIKNVWPYLMTKMYTMNANIRPYPFMPRYLNNSLKWKTPLDQM